ncbi:hypothetical protein R6Z07F_019502 [Ovis aries]
MKQDVENSLDSKHRSFIQLRGIDESGTGWVSVVPSVGNSSRNRKVRGASLYKALVLRLLLLAALLSHSSDTTLQVRSRVAGMRSKHDTACTR